jgi:flagellar assembly protein FliH
MTLGKGKIRNVPPPQGQDAKANYARFIPREELESFSSWTPSAFGAAPAEREPPPEDPAALMAAARAQGYQDGYRDGLAALEQFKQTYAMQVSTQIGALLHTVGTQLDALQQQIAESVAGSATLLARQVVRSELEARPELVAQVAQEAIDALMLSARHITLRVHPEEQPLIAQGAAEVIEARGARLVADASVARGGCIVESDLGAIDASIETRWARAAAALGSQTGWTDAEPDGDSHSGDAS